MNTERDQERKNRQRERVFCLFLVLLCFLPGVVLAQIIPADRTIPWQGNVGVEGGIPSRTKLRNCVLKDGAHTMGSDTSGQINACISHTPAGGVAYLPPGTYVVTSSIRLQSNKTLRGAGMGLTIIRGDADLLGIIDIYGGYTDCTGGAGAIGILSGHTKGSTRIVLVSAFSISVGDFLYLSELNDSSIPVKPDGGYGLWRGGCYGSNGLRNRTQIAKVTGKSGKTLTISPPLYFTFSSGNNPTATRTPAYIQYAGVEDLTVKIGKGTRTRANIHFQGSANSWVKNVKIENCGKRCISFDIDNYRNELRDSYMTGCVDRENSDTCYGTEIMSSSAILIENNIYDNTANGPVLVTSSGNVIGYNYFYGVHRTNNLATWFWNDNWTHGSHCSYNLWEGNHMSGLAWDVYWGSNSHNTAFRNRITSKDATVKYSAYHQEVSAIGIGTDNHYSTAVGNILGTPNWSAAYDVRNTNAWVTNAIYAIGAPRTDNAAFTTFLRHMNYDYYTNSVKYCNLAGEPGCQSGDGSTVLPSSLYLSAKPSFFGNCAWPVFGPDLSPMEKTLPAKARFEGNHACEPASTPGAAVQPRANLQVVF
jgi:hypothetical protein